MKGRKRILSAIICVAMILTLFSGVAMAQGGEPTVTLDMPQTFNVGEPVEFSISTTGGDKAGTMVLGTADWDGAAAVEKLEYKEGDSWMELKGDHFGPASGFPLGDFTSEFRVTFKEAGTFSLTVKIVEATNPDNVLTQTSSTIRSIVAPTVTVNAPESFAVGEAAEFTVTTTPGDLQGTMVLGRFTYDESKVEKLEYLESKDNKWYELTGNSFGPPATGFPLMEATSKFRVTFKEAGDVSFKIDIVPFSGGNALASAEDTFLSVAPTPEEVTVTPEVVSGNAEISGDTILLTENTPATIAFIPDGDLDIIEYQYSAAYPADADIEDVTDWLTADYLVPTYAFGSLAVGTYDFTLTLTENTNYETVFQKVYQIKVEEAAPATEDVYYKDTETGVTLYADTTLVPEGAYLIVDPIEGTEQDYAGAKELLKDKAGKFVLYDITLVNAQGEAIQPEGPVVIGIPVPEGYDTAKLAVHRLNEDKTTVEYEVAMQEGMAYIQTDHFSKYALIEKGSMTDAGQTGGTDDTKTDGTASETPKTNDTADIMPYILLVAAAGAAAILAVAMNRKKQHSEK